MGKKRIIDCINDTNKYLIKVYSNILSKDRYSRVFIPLADIYLKNKRSDEALSLCREGIKIYPNYVSARVMLGKIYFETGMLKEAKEQFVKATELSKNNLLSYKMLYKIYSSSDEDALALMALKEIVRIDKRDKNFIDALSELENTIRYSTYNKTIDTDLQPGVPGISKEAYQYELNIPETRIETDTNAIGLEIIESGPEDKFLEDFNMQPYFISTESTKPFEEIIFPEESTIHSLSKGIIEKVYDDDKRVKNKQVITTLEKWLYNAKRIKGERGLPC